jgi:DNA-3-methyladenine glycosylase II
LLYSHSVVRISYQSVSNPYLIKLNQSVPSTSPFEGDLGVQRGVCRWYLSLHSDEHPITVSPEKKKTPAKPKKGKKGKKAAANKVNGGEEEAEADDNGGTGVGASGDPAGTVTNIPPPFTSSVTKILKTKPLSNPPPGLPDGLSVATLKSRLSGKKVK